MPPILGCAGPIRTIHASNIEMLLGLSGLFRFLILGCAQPIWTIHVSNIEMLLGLSVLFRFLILECARPTLTIHVSNIRMCSAYPDYSCLQYWDVLGLSGLFMLPILRCCWAYLDYSGF